MWDENGCVKVRVSRFDEDHTIGGTVIHFLNGLPLWQFVYRHPMHAADTVDTSQLGTCANADQHAPGAFMVNKTGDACWTAAEGLIKQGYISETCARYELKEDPTKQGKWTYDIKFRECKSCCRSSPEYHQLADD